MSLSDHQPEWAWFNEGSDQYRIAKANTACLDRGGNPIPTGSVEHGDAIGIDMPENPFLARWTAAVNDVAAAVSRALNVPLAHIAKAWGKKPDRHHPVPIPKGRGAAYARRRRHR